MTEKFKENNTKTKKNLKKYIILIILMILTSVSYCTFKYLYKKKYYNSFKDKIINNEELFDESEILANEEVLKNSFNIAYCTDKNYLLPTYVSAYSLLKNSNLEDNYIINFLISPDVNNEEIKKIRSLEQKFKNCLVNVVNMGEVFDKSDHKGWSRAVYYRLLLPSVLKNTSKCLYIDGDTIVRKDISKIFSIDIGDNYVAGVRDYNGLINNSSQYNKEVLLTDNLDTYICSGVLFMNLNKIREKKIDEEFLKLVKINDIEHKYKFVDQDMINIACFGHIHCLPCEYGLLLHINYNESYEKSDYAKYASTEEEWEIGRKDPKIAHFTDPKAWIRIKNNNNEISIFAQEWWRYANETDYRDEIYEKYKSNFNDEERSIITQNQ